MRFSVWEARRIHCGVPGVIDAHFKTLTTLKIAIEKNKCRVAPLLVNVGISFILNRSPFLQSPSYSGLPAVFIFLKKSPFESQTELCKAIPRQRCHCELFEGMIRFREIRQSLVLEARLEL
jgi:hypothetical protein